MTSGGDRPVRVAVIGGGCAGMTAAFELSRPEHQGRYQVTVYQVGWRLGGKGASARGPAGRIEEHGLHLWMGWYENAFRLMRDCYAQLGRDPRQCPIATWRDAFVPAPHFGVIDRIPGGGWLPWIGSLPATDGLPGDPFEGGQRFGVRDYMLRSVALLGTLLRTIESTDGSSPAGSPSFAIAGASPELVQPILSRLLRYGEIATLVGLVQAVALLEVMIGSLGAFPESLVLQLLDAIASNARNLLEARLGGDATLRRAWQVIDLTLATLRGEIRFGIVTDPRGFDAIDEYDCREWLLLNGASESSVDSGFVRGLYDLGFSYQDGDAARPRISAGQALRSMVRAFFTYRGSFFWRMQAGMGDVVFAPLYQLLSRRGVKFEFFHRLANVKIADRSRLAPGESPYVTALELDVQAEVRGGAPYQPLIDIAGLPCWPSRPDFGQLVDGERLEAEGVDFESFWDQRQRTRKVLHVVEDFDLVVLAVGLGAIPHVCSEIVAHDPRWRAMVDHVKTVATQAFQIWMSADASELGWNGPAIALSGFVEPFDTWADMAHLLPREAWKSAPRSLAYFCNVLPENELRRAPEGPGFVPAIRERVRRNALEFLNRDIAHLWPKAVSETGEFRYELLVDPAAAPSAGERRFDSQFWTANVNPSDRYVLSLPGSNAYRISPLDRSYDNLTIAGDWTDCGFNAGCVEAAVMSGRLAAHAISQRPALEEIVGFDHP